MNLNDKRINPFVVSEMLCENAEDKRFKEYTTVGKTLLDEFAMRARKRNDHMMPNDQRAKEQYDEAEAMLRERAKRLGIKIEDNG